MTPATTADRTILPGDPTGQGTDGTYRGLRYGPGEPHRARTDFAPAAPPGRGRRVVATLAHLTDLHVADPGSPARLDFAMRTGNGHPSWGGVVDWVFRPQETLTAHAARAMIGTLAALPADVCVVTGDNIDNSQGNELGAYLALLDGGEVRLFPDGYDGPQRADDDWYWRPGPGGDAYKRRWGFPTRPGLLEAATRPFTAAPLGRPWLACLGNHDLLAGGAIAGRAALGPLVTGDRKPVALPPGLDLPDALGALLRDPAPIFAGPSRPITPDAGRAFVTREEIIARHLAAGGHGFTDANLRDGTACYAYDPVPGLRVIVLDTNHPYGHWDGSVDQRQLAWLADRLAETSGPGDPLVVLASHHATASLNNRYGVPAQSPHDRSPHDRSAHDRSAHDRSAHDRSAHEPDAHERDARDRGVCPDRPAERAYAAEVLRTALRCPNVVLWLNGHHHANRVVAHYRPGGGGLYEVTTSAITDWPSQARLIEIAIEPDGRIALTTTMIDHAAPTVPGADLDPAGLAALHRELAYNDGVRAGRRGATGSPLDRNLRMLLPARHRTG